MKLTHGEMDNVFIGCHIILGLSQSQDVQIEVSDLSSYSRTVQLLFPVECSYSKMEYLKKAITQVRRGTAFPVRLNYDELIRHFSLEELNHLERCMRNISLYIYRVPKDILPELTSSLDIHSLHNKIRRIKDQEKRKAHMINHANSV